MMVKASKKDGGRWRGKSAGRMGLPALAAALLLMALPGGRLGADLPNASSPASPLQGVGIVQRLNHQIPLDLTFRDETGKTVHLADYFGQKPVILSLVYFTCPMLCTTVENGLVEGLKNLNFNIGNQFNVLTVSFDPQDTPAMAATKKAVYLGEYGRPGAAAGWHFLTGDEQNIHQLTEAVGFHYNYDPKTDQYYHATGIMVLTPQGKLSRYFYGIQYPSGSLRLSLVAASHEKIGSPVDELLLYCCQYNPATGKYDLVVSRALQVGGVITLLILGTMMLVISRAKPRRHV